MMLLTGLPVSSMIKLARSSCISSRASFARERHAPLSAQVRLDHEVNALLAATTASFTSSSVATGTSHRGCLLEGFTPWATRTPRLAAPLMVLVNVKKALDELDEGAMFEAA